jgi:long-chain acyl-CoA synthetase
MKELKSLTLKSVLERSLELYPQRPALSWVDGDSFTYKQVADKIQEISLFLNNNGIITGDRVAILAENSPNWGISYLAITTMGAVVVPILPDFHENEVQHILRHSGAKAIFVSEKHYGKLDLSIGNLLQILIDDFRIIPAETTKEKLKKIISSGPKGFAKFKESALKATGLLSRQVQEEDLAAIIYTSGTTGNSKGVMLTHRNLVFNTIDTLNIQDMNENDRFLSVLPLPHTYECTVGFLLPFSCGAAVYYLDKPPVARVLLPAMNKIRPTMMLTVPLIIEKIFKTKIQPKFTQSPFLHGIYKLPLFRRILHKAAGNKLYKSFGGKLHFFGIGGALLAPDVERFLRDAKFPYAIGYGLTETSPLIAGCSPKVTKFRSTGTVLPGLEVKIAGAENNKEIGEILVKGPSIMKGYYKDQQRTREVLSEDGWFKTGDFGILKKDRYLYIKGRLKNVIVGPSGENIYPEEIEAIIGENDYVLESVVYSQENRIIARIHLNYELLDEHYRNAKTDDTQMKNMINKLLEEIRKEVNQRVSQFSRINKAIEQPDPFMKTPTKKIKRYLYMD